MDNLFNSRPVLSLLGVAALAAGCDPSTDPTGFGVGMSVVTVVIVIASILVSLVVTIVPLIFVGMFLMKLMKKKEETAKILAAGQTATATVMSIGETGTYINNQPLVGILLTVQPPGRTPYQARVERLISQLEIPRVQPGMTVVVKIDPSDPSKVAIDLNQPVNVPRFCGYCHQSVPAGAARCPSCGAPVQ